MRVLVRRSASAELNLSYRLDGDIAGLRIFSPAAERMATQLWQHTCFEAFIAVDGQSAYHEFNFAPSRKWAVYAFSGYRNGGPQANESLRPHIAVRTTDTTLQLDSRVQLDALSAIHPKAPLRLGLSAVIEGNNGLSYWALRHPVDKPDFHHADGFALLIEAPVSSEKSDAKLETR